jgi:hypothetical protein
MFIHDTGRKCVLIFSMPQRAKSAIFPYFAITLSRGPTASFFADHLRPKPSTANSSEERGQLSASRHQDLRSFSQVRTR